MEAMEQSAWREARFDRKWNDYSNPTAPPGLPARFDRLTANGQRSKRRVDRRAARPLIHLVAAMAISIPATIAAAIRIAHAPASIDSR
jgi:hypothetical protein